MPTIPMICFSDVLCIWAYFAETRIAALKAEFADQIRLEHRFCSVFGDTERKMATTWRDRGGHAGFNAHLMEAAAKLPEISVNPQIWQTVKPASSTSPHLFLKAVQAEETAGLCAPGTFEAALLAMREAFFRDAQDIGCWSVQCAVGTACDIELTAIEGRIHDGTAFAALASDYEAASAMTIQGSPSFILNDGRQTLYGNVGYRILQANIQELLRSPTPDQASWC